MTICGHPTKSGRDCSIVVDALPCHYHDNPAFLEIVKSIRRGDLMLTAADIDDELEAEPTPPPPARRALPPLDPNYVPERVRAYQWAFSRIGEEIEGLAGHRP